MIAALIPVIGNIVGNLIDKSVEDKDEAAKLKGTITAKLIELETKDLEAAMNIIVAEAQSESWLTRSWRPITMLTFVALIAAHWLGFTPANLPEEQVLSLLEIVKVGLGGYVLGRSAERVMKEYKK